MESYCKVAIMITAKELTAISAAVQGKVCKAVCDASEDAAEELDSVFFGALDEALGRIGIVLEFEDAGRVEKGTYNRHRQCERAASWRRSRQKPGVKGSPRIALCPQSQMRW